MKTISMSDEAEWHVHRSKLLTGSNAAYAVLAMTFDCDPVAIENAYGPHIAKRVASMLSGEPRDLSDNNNVFWGSRSERFNMDVFAESSGVRCVHTNRLVTADGDHNIPLASTLDAIGEISGEVGLFRPVTAAPVRWKRTMDEISGWTGMFPVELKQTARPALREWSGSENDLPFGFRVQVQVQMWAMGAEYGLVVGKVSVADMRVIPVYADGELMKKVIEASHWMAERRLRK